MPAREMSDVGSDTSDADGEGWRWWAPCDVDRGERERAEAEEGLREPSTRRGGARSGRRPRTLLLGRRSGRGGRHGGGSGGGGGEGR